MAGSRVRTDGRPEEWRPPVGYAGKLLASADQAAAPSLLNYCDRMLAKWRGAEALLVWNGLAERKLVGYPDLRQPGSGHGFDWQVWPAEGIHANRSADGLILRFSGNNLKTSKF